jgi:hypothetical protein
VSLVVFSSSNVSAIAGLALDVDFLLLDSKEFLDKVIVLRVVHEVKLAGSPVFNLRMLQKFLRDLCASEKPDCFKVEVGLFSEHANSAKSKRSKFRFTSLHKAFEEVCKLPLDSAFISIFLVLEVPVSKSVVESSRLELFLSLGDTITSHIGQVHEESFVVIHYEVSLRKLFFSRFLFFFLDNRGRLLLRFLLSSRRLWLGFSEYRLKTLSADLYDTVDLDKLR